VRAAKAFDGAGAPLTRWPVLALSRPGALGLRPGSARRTASKQPTLAARGTPHYGRPSGRGREFMLDGTGDEGTGGSSSPDVWVRAQDSMIVRPYGTLNEEGGVRNRDGAKTAAGKVCAWLALCALT
jgi:hypothetical protein